MVMELSESGNERYCPNAHKPTTRKLFSLLENVLFFFLLGSIDLNFIALLILNSQNKGEFECTDLMCEKVAKKMALK